MHGTNPILKQDLTRGNALAIEHVFYTIQGEGPFAGRPAVFIRTSGCNLRCHFCDTSFMEGINTAYTPAQVVKMVRDAEDTVAGEQGKNWQPRPLVVITGGEPLRQNILPLCAMLTGAPYCYDVQIETAGTVWVPGLEALCYEPNPYNAGVSIVVSPKTGKVAVEVAERAYAWKYIIDADDERASDGLPASSTQVVGQHQLLCRPPSHVPSDQIYLQPCDREDPTKNRRNMELVTQLALKHGYRVSLQTHKILGVE